MLTKLLFSLSIISLSTFAMSSSRHEVINKQAKHIVAAIDDLCQDTWCEMNYEFKFNEFTCSKKSCELSFQMHDAVHAKEQNKAVGTLAHRIMSYKTHEASCTFKDFSSLDQIAVWKIYPNGIRFMDLQEAFIFKIDRCILELHTDLNKAHDTVGGSIDLY